MAPYQANILVTTPIIRTGLRFVILGGTWTWTRSRYWSARFAYSGGWTKSESVVDRAKDTLIRCSAPGPHIFLVFISLSTCTEVEKKSGLRIHEAFGPNAGRHSMVVFTHEDDLKGATIEDVLAKDPGLQDLVSRCNCQYHVFNTLRSDKALADELLPKIQQIVKKNGGSYYTNEMYEQWKNELKEKEKEDRMRRLVNMRMHAFRDNKEREKEAQRKEEEKKEKQREEQRWLVEKVKCLKEAMKEIIKQGRIKEAQRKEEEEREKQKKEKQREEKRRKKEWRRKKEFMEELIKKEQERIRKAQKREEEERQQRCEKIEKILMVAELREQIEQLETRRRSSILYRVFSIFM